MYKTTAAAAQRTLRLQLGVSLYTAFELLYIARCSLPTTESDRNILQRCFFGTAVSCCRYFDSSPITLSVRVEPSVWCVCVCVSVRPCPCPDNNF